MSFKILNDVTLHTLLARFVITILKHEINQFQIKMIIFYHDSHLVFHSHPTRKERSLSLF